MNNTDKQKHRYMSVFCKKYGFRYAPIMGSELIKTHVVEIEELDCFFTYDNIKYCVDENVSKSTLKAYARQLNNIQPIEYLHEQAKENYFPANVYFVKKRGMKLRLTTYLN